MFYTPFACEHLDEKTRLCRIYQRRHQVNPQCLSVPDGLKLGVFPGDCPYAQNMPNYKAPVLNVLSKDLLELVASGKVNDL